jgi:HAD superfamily hydrolase (TIGR01509 family)
MSFGNGNNGIPERKALHYSQENTPAMKKTAVIDIDNTLWQFCDAFYRVLKELHANFPPIDQWTTFDFWEQYCSEQEFMAAINSIHRDQDNDRYQPYPEARDFLLSLKKREFYIIIASHRFKATRQPTERWLARHQLTYDELHLSFEKSVLFDQAAVVVDDAPHTLEKAVASGALAAGLLFPWNRAYVGNGIGLFRDLNDVLGYILTSTAGRHNR